MEAVIAWVQNKYSVFPPTTATDRGNKYQGFLNAPSLSLFLSLLHPSLFFRFFPLSSPHSSTDGGCHIRCFLFAHQTRGHSCTALKPATDVAASLPDNHCRWNTFWGWNLKAQKNKCCLARNYFGSPGEPLRSVKQYKDKFAKFVLSFATYSSWSTDRIEIHSRQEEGGGWCNTDL